MQNPQQTALFKPQFGMCMLKRQTMYWLATATLTGLLGMAAHAQSAPPSTYAQASAATAHWHCSKHPHAPEFELAMADDEDDFFDLTQASPSTLGVSLPDLIDVYNGRRVQMGSRHLTACFMVGQHALNHSAQERVGLQWASLQQLQRRSAISHNHVRMVQTESEMLQCIANHYPAVGYLSQPTETAAVAPCF
jgi:hypothetical protein